MIRACSEFVVQGSNFEDPNSSEGESVPVKLSRSELKASLKDISSFKGMVFFYYCKQILLEIF